MQYYPPCFADEEISLEFSDNPILVCRLTPSGRLLKSKRLRFSSELQKFRGTDPKQQYSQFSKSSQLIPICNLYQDTLDFLKIVSKLGTKDVAMLMQNLG